MPYTIKLILYNDCWKGFWVRSWLPRALWQAVTLWLVNRGMAVRRGWPVEQVCNRKVTTCYENHAVSFKQSVQSESRVEPGIRNRSEMFVLSLTIRLARGCKRWHPLAPERRYEAKSPLSEYMSLHLSLKLTTNCVPLSRIKWERNIFIKKCFVRSLSLFMFLVGSTRSIQHLFTVEKSCTDIFWFFCSLRLLSLLLTCAKFFY